MLGVFFLTGMHLQLGRHLLTLKCGKIASKQPLINQFHRGKHCFQYKKCPLIFYCQRHMPERKEYYLTNVNFETFKYSNAYSTISESPLNVFDRKMKFRQKEFSAHVEDRSIYDYLKEEIGNRVADRVYDITRKFEIGVELGCGRGHISKHLTNENIGFLFQCDHSKSLLDISTVSETIPTTKLAVDEEHLPFISNSVNIFFSSLNFHWINNLPGTFEQIYAALKPDGVLIASMFGGETLFELRSSLQLAETEREGGFSPHISPFARIRDIGDLLSRAGYTMLTIDTDEIRVNYPTMFELMWDLQGMAESNVSWNRQLHLKKDSMIAAAAIYQKMYGNDDGTIPATFQIIYLIGWKPDVTQPKPAKRGSGTVSLKDISKLSNVA